jgi:hypothetical protein
MSYRPLPDSLTIKDSSIHGLGIFATCDIPEKTVLGIAHVKMVEWLNFPQDYCRTPLGGFYNHSDTPNCTLEDCDQIKRLVTIMDIRRGEEVTCKYTLYEVGKI